jgi:hypothetical protein
MEELIRTTILLDEQVKSGTIIKIDGVTYKVKSSLQEGFLFEGEGCFTTLEVVE